MNPPAVFRYFLPKQTEDIWCIPSVSWAVFTDSNSLMKTPSDVYWNTGLQKGFSFQNFHSHVLTLHKNLKLWMIFSDLVHHSKFSTLLSWRTPFKWLTSGLFSGFRINVSATRRCTEKVIFHSHLYKPTCTYPWQFGLTINNFSFQDPLKLKVFTLPALLTSYLPSYQKIGFQISSIFNKIIRSVREAQSQNNTSLTQRNKKRLN